MNSPLIQMTYLQFMMVSVDPHGVSMDKLVTKKGRNFLAQTYLAGNLPSPNFFKQSLLEAYASSELLQTRYLRNDY